MSLRLLWYSRECISVSVYYAKSGDSTWADITTAPTVLDEPFMQFLNCIGWPVKKKKRKESARGGNLKTFSFAPQGRSETSYGIQRKT